MDSQLVESKDERYEDSSDSEDDNFDFDPSTSVYEYDPTFEYDAAQYFDFLDINALYCRPIERQNNEEEWISGEDWFLQTHEGHEPEYPSIAVRLLEDELEYDYYDQNDGFVSSCDNCSSIDENYAESSSNQLSHQYSPDYQSSLLKTPVKLNSNTLVKSPSQNRLSPTSTQFYSESLHKTPSSIKKKPQRSIFSPITNNAYSPLKGGAQRIVVPLSPTESSNKTAISPVAKSSQKDVSITTILPSRNPTTKKFGAQRVAVSSIEPESPPPIKTNTQNVKKISTSSSIMSDEKTRSKPVVSSKVVSPPSTKILPRYLDTSKPSHQTQIPPRALASLVRAQSKENISRQANQSRVTQRKPTQLPEKQQPTTRNPLSNRSNTLNLSIDGELAQLLAEHNKKFKPKPVYEPRKFGIKEIREWEALKGLRWYDLTAEQRQEANEEMSMMRKAAVEG